MKQKTYFKMHKRICKEARKLSKAKNDDYADPTRYPDDPLAIFRNFLQCENQGICSVEKGFLVRLSDKSSRLCNILQEGKKISVKDEKIEDTVKDEINYLILLLAYINTKEKMLKKKRKK